MIIHNSTIRIQLSVAFWNIYFQIFPPMYMSVAIL